MFVLSFCCSGGACSLARAAELEGSLDGLRRAVGQAEARKRTEDDALEEVTETTKACFRHTPCRRVRLFDRRDVYSCKGMLLSVDHGPQGGGLLRDAAK